MESEVQGYVESSEEFSLTMLHDIPFSTVVALPVGIACTALMACANFVRDHDNCV